MMPADNDLIRTLVREALRDAVATRPDMLRQSRPAAVTEVVALGSDADLAGFVARIADMCEDAATREQLRTGGIAFSLASGSASPTPGGGAGAAAGSVTVVERGAVTEAMVRKAAETGSALHLGPRAVLTSLAKDKAKAMGVEIVKTSHNGKGAR